MELKLFNSGAIKLEKIQSLKSEKFRVPKSKLEFYGSIVTCVALVRSRPIRKVIFYFRVAEIINPY